MPDRAGSGTDPTLTPNQAIAIAPTSASATEHAVPAQPSSGRLPARYRLGAQLGAGGMGEVLLATDTQIERDVAIKRMRIEPNDETTARFVREAKIQGRLDHPAIVPVHELGVDDDGRPFFVMKRLTGTTLADLLARDAAARPPRAKLLRAFADVCLAIAFAHRHGVIHRDLKPANIMLGDFGEVYVLDWGVARILDETEDPAVTGSLSGSGDSEGSTKVGAILGTPGYIAPEMMRAATRPEQATHVDTRADVYALGCILFELLAGEALLPRGRAALQVDFDAIDARPSVRAPAGDIPPELDAICVAATASTPSKRPSARELGEQIERFLDGDRDLALRKSLAEQHLVSARAALAKGDAEAERATAMREAGRALALDPRSPGAAEIVGRLMLEPPKVAPREVDDRVAEIEEDTAVSKVKLVLWVQFSFLIFVPFVFVMGMRSGLVLTLLIASIVISIGHTAYIVRRGACRASDMYIAATLVSVLIGMIARGFSPYLFAPGIAAVSVMMFVADPRARWHVIAVVTLAGVLVPWGLEGAGVLSRSMFYEQGAFVMRPPIVNSTQAFGDVGLVVYTLTLVGLAGFMSARLATRHREVVRSVELQSWHLRQLVHQ